MRVEMCITVYIFKQHQCYTITFCNNDILQDFENENRSYLLKLFQYEQNHPIRLRGFTIYAHLLIKRLKFFKITPAHSILPQGEKENFCFSVGHYPFEIVHAKFTY